MPDVGALVQCRVTQIVQRVRNARGISEATLDTEAFAQKGLGRGVITLIDRQRCQIIDAVPRHDDDAAPFAAIAAVRSAARHPLLAPKADAAIAAPAPLHFDFNAKQVQVSGALAMLGRGR